MTVAAVVGATGAVGREMVRILEERSFPVDELVLLASERTAGTRLPFRGQDVTVGLLSQDALAGIDVALSSCGSSVAKSWLPAAAEAGTTCIDNSSAFRMDPDAALTIPEVNPESLEGRPKIVCVPNCTIITTLMALAPLHRAAGLRSPTPTMTCTLPSPRWPNTLLSNFGQRRPSAALTSSR